ncbi:MAG: VWA domain-containing protein [Propionibacteriaceae bacterium]|nr:VWA domain-containing protein [Propionibacteriaceae bacterium]
MTNQDYTDITVVLDRSGSMATIKTDMEGGFNHFIAEQAKDPGDCRVSLAQFDTDYETVYSQRPIGQVPALDLQPRGGTALLDAMGRSINETGQRLAAMAEADRPGVVFFVIITDGCENSSKEFSSEQIKQLVERQENTYGWQFTYLGANQDALVEAGKMGIRAEAALTYDTDAGSIAGMAGALSRSATAIKKAYRDGASVQELRTMGAYTSDERAATTKRK